MDWKADLEEVARVDDHLWVGLIAHDMWNSGKEYAIYSYRAPSL